jgi:hypothetical protein
MADVECGALICDPPYSARTHAGSDAVADRTRDGSDRQTLAYAWWTADDVAEFVAAWAPRTRSWMCAMTDSTLIPAWTHAYTMADRYAFAPVPILQHRPRISGDGPASCAVYLMVSRPRQKRFAQWGSLPGWYLSRPEHAVGVQGAKPSDLMRAIIRDYSRPGDMICDPCAGGATTLIAAQIEGRDSIGSEMDPKTHARAMRRIQYGRHAAKADDQPCFDFDRRP